MGSLFKSPKTPPPPVIRPPAPMANPEDIAREKRRSIAEQQKRGGRQSTILTDEIGL